MRALLTLIVAAGCARPVPPPAAVDASTPTPPVPVVVQISPLVGLLDGAGQALLLPRERQAEEIARIEAGLADADLPTDRLRLAVLLTLGDPELRDEPRAAALLEGRTWSDTGYETVARLILAVVDERSERAADREELAAQLEQQRRRAEALEGRLEALRDIETEMHRDEEAGDAHGDGKAEGPGR